MTAGRIVSVDSAVAKVADEYVICEFAEARRCQRDAPRRREVTVLGEMLEQIAVGIEDADKAVRRLVDRVVLGLVLQGVGNPQVVVDGLDTEWRVALLHVWIAERPRHVYLIEVAVEDVDIAGAKVGC